MVVINTDTERDLENYSITGVPRVISRVLGLTTSFMSEDQKRREDYGPFYASSRGIDITMPFSILSQEIA